MRPIAQRSLLAIVGGVAALAVMGASSCDTTTGAPAGSTTPSATAQDLALGAALHVTDAGVSAFVTVERVTFALSGDGGLAQPPKNGLYAVVDVLIQDDAGAYEYNPVDVRYQERDGTTYLDGEGNAVTAGFDPTLFVGTLNPGQKARGNVVFDVKAKGGIVQVTDSLFRVIGQWTVPAT